VSWSFAVLPSVKVVSLKDQREVNVRGDVGGIIAILVVVILVIVLLRLLGIF
jgi:hypothetical protein